MPVQVNELTVAYHHFPTDSQVCCWGVQFILLFCVGCRRWRDIMLFTASQRYSALRTVDIKAHELVANATALSLEVCYFRPFSVCARHRRRIKHRLGGLGCALCGDYQFKFTQQSRCYCHIKTELYIGKHE